MCQEGPRALRVWLLIKQFISDFLRDSWTILWSLWFDTVILCSRIKCLQNPKATSQAVCNKPLFTFILTSLWVSQPLPHFPWLLPHSPQTQHNMRKEGILSIGGGSYVATRPGVCVSWIGSPLWWFGDGSQEALRGAEVKTGLTACCPHRSLPCCWNCQWTNIIGSQHAW